MTRTIRLTVLTLFIGLFTSTVMAQQSCSALVARAMEALNTNCTDVSRNNACYGYNRVEAAFAEAVPDDFFTQPADTAELATLQTIETAPLDEELDEWGVALMMVQANIPNTLPGQNVVMVLMGDSKVAAAEGEAPMQAFYFTTGLGAANCTDAPDSVVIQSPENITVNLTVNDAQIELSSTAVLSIVDEGDAFELTMADGEAVINGEIMVTEGFWAKIPLNTEDALENGLFAVSGEDPLCRAVPEDKLPPFQTLVDSLPDGVLNYDVDTIEWDERGCVDLTEE